jgi:hypothetical protein
MPPGRPVDVRQRALIKCRRAVDEDVTATVPREYLGRRLPGGLFRGQVAGHVPGTVDDNRLVAGQAQG